MSEEIKIDSGLTKKEKFNVLLPQIISLIKGERNFIANVSNIMAVLKFELDLFWVGVYLVDTDDLVLGPFQGPLACTRIKKGKGVCGKTWEKVESIVVPNVHEFEGHIACSSMTNSEIVVPIIKAKECIGVLDVDSVKFDDFDNDDKEFYEKIAQIIADIYEA